jgi:hypothetical protein
MKSEQAVDFAWQISFLTSFVHLRYFFEQRSQPWYELWFSKKEVTCRLDHIVWLTWEAIEQDWDYLRKFLNLSIRADVRQVYHEPCEFFDNQSAIHEVNSDLVAQQKYCVYKTYTFADFVLTLLDVIYIWKQPSQVCQRRQNIVFFPDSVVKNLAQIG